MRRATSAAALALAMAVGGAAEAQETMETGRGASRFDLGVYAGGSVGSPWYRSRLVTVANGAATDVEGSEESFTPGYAPAFGAAATYWATPGLGVRLHGAYLPMRRPFLSDGPFDVFEPDDAEEADVDDASTYSLNTWVYDLDLVFRPWAGGGAPGWLAGVYLFLGGGGLTTDAAGSDPGCEPVTLARGACLPFDPELASVGQGTLGAGMDLLRLGPSVGVFGELAAHGYDSPVHVGDAWVPPARLPTGGQAAVAEDRFAVTTRLVLGLKLRFGDLRPAPAMAPVPPPPAVLPPPPPAPAMPETRTIRVCVVQDAELREVEAAYDPATGDTTVAGQPFARAYPPTAGYAAGATWYIDNEPITLLGRRYVRFGLPRVVSPAEVRRAGEYRGVGVYAEAAATGTPDVVYVPVRPGCELQPYQHEVPARGVRG